MTQKIREQIIEAARECIDTPFRHQGRNPKQGLDCVGLVRYPGVKLGLYAEDVDVRNYGPYPQPEMMHKLLMQFFLPIEPEDKQPGDIVWMNAPDPQHLAIYTGPTIIHACQQGYMRVVEHGFRSPFPGRVVQWFRYRGVA